MKNKFFISTILLIVFVLIVVFIVLNNNNETALKDQEKVEKIKIAACPTCYEMVKGLDNRKYNIVLTNSTFESIEMFKSGQVDFILAGRTLKPGEPKLKGVAIKRGYSFLAKQGGVIYANQLKNYNIYTDLDTNQLKNSLPIDKIEKVNDVYQYLDKGIIITSWENTDYMRGEIVHVLEDNGKRLTLSRRPTIYCPSFCDSDILASLISVLK